MDGRQTTQPDQLIDAGDVDTETRRYLFHFEERLVGWLARRAPWQSREGGQGRGYLEKSLPSLRGRVHGCLSQVLDERRQFERLGLQHRCGRHRLGGRCHAGAAMPARRGTTATSILITVGVKRAPITVPARARRVGGSQLRAGSA